MRVKNTVLRSKLSIFDRTRLVITIAVVFTHSGRPTACDTTILRKSIGGQSLLATIWVCDKALLT